MNYSPNLIQSSEVITVGSKVKFVKAQAKLKQIDPKQVYTVNSDKGSRVTLDGLAYIPKKSFLYLADDVDPTIDLETSEAFADESAQIKPTPAVVDSNVVSDEIKPKRFKFAVNTHVINKDKNFEALAAKFEDTEGDLNDVINHVLKGHALCAGLLGGNRRDKDNFIGSHWILLDIDNTAIKLDENGKKVKDENGNAKYSCKYIYIFKQ